MLSEGQRKYCLQAKFSVPREMHALEQGLLFVSPSSSLLQGTVFAAPTAQYARAASPDALLVGDGAFKTLLELKCACPFTEKDDGRGWVVSLQACFWGRRHSCKTLCAVPSSNGGCSC